MVAPSTSSVDEKAAPSATVSPSSVVAPSTSNVPVTEPLPLTVMLSDTATVPPEESNVRLPEDVDTVLPFTVTLSAAMSPVTVRVPTMFVASKSVVPSTSKFPLKSAFPANVKLDAMSTAPSISTASKLEVPSTSKFPLKSALPANVRLDAMSTAPSISTASKFVVPSMSILPDISRLAAVIVPAKVALPLLKMVAFSPIGVSAPRTLTPAISIPTLCKLDVPVFTVVSLMVTVPLPNDAIPVTRISPRTMTSVLPTPTVSLEPLASRVPMIAAFSSTSSVSI